MFNGELAELRRVKHVWDGFDPRHFKVCSGALFIFLEANSIIMKVINIMGLAHKDWELPNSRIWLAEMDIDRSLDFPI